MEQEITILYEDADVVVINKPMGLVAHSDSRATEPSVADWVLKHRPEAKGVGDEIKDSRLKFSAKGGSAFGGKDLSAPNNQNLRIASRPGIVHRLDRETSGALIIAKNQAAFLSLKKQFQSRAIRKIYRAFVYGEMKEDKGVIDRPLGKSRKDFRLFSAQRGARGMLREAITEYEVLARHGGFSFISLMPKTGRTHQIRAHLKAINHPVVSDRLYAPNREPALGFTRLALHAFSLTFKLPSGKELSVEAPYPEDFKRAIKIFGYADESAPPAASL